MSARTYHVHCAAEGCTSRIGKGQLFCKDHYFALPRALRDDLWAAWRRAMEVYRVNMTRDEQELRNRAYQDAFRACVEHLRSAPRTDAAAMSTVAIAATGEPVRFVEGRRL
ncbi:hypothetical protein SAMN02927924_01666 [Sphingobium faniae]|nr:hypothetical protein SAMN02927924_01666 [Sphingobium faniae]